MSDPWLEWVVEGEFVMEIEDAGWITFKGDKVRRGFPDRFCFGYEARVVIVEFKSSFAPKKRKGEKLQDHYRQMFRERGFEVYKVTGKEEANKLRDKLLEKNGG